MAQIVGPGKGPGTDDRFYAACPHGRSGGEEDCQDRRRPWPGGGERILDLGSQGPRIEARQGRLSVLGHCREGTPR